MAQEGRGGDRGLPSGVMPPCFTAPPVARRKYLPASTSQVAPRPLEIAAPAADCPQIVLAHSPWDLLPSHGVARGSTSNDNTRRARPGNPKPPPSFGFRGRRPLSAASDAPPLSATSPSY